MVFLFECSNPFRKTWKIEKIGPLRRFIWGWFSVSYIGAGFNDIWRAMREDEREECAILGARTMEEMGRKAGGKIHADGQVIADAIRARSNV